MGGIKDLSVCEKGHVVIARRLGQSISDTARLVWCSWSAVVPIDSGQSGQPQTTDRVLGVQGFLMHEGSKGCSIHQKSQNIVMMVTGGMCHNTLHCTLQLMRLRSRRPDIVPMIPPSVGTGPWSSGRRSPGPMSPILPKHFQTRYTPS